MSAACTGEFIEERNANRRPQRAWPSVAVTDELDHFNNMLYLIDGCKYAPRWMRVRIVELIDDNTALVQGVHFSFDDPLRVRIRHCDDCGTAFTRDPGYAKGPFRRCRTCDRIAIADQQRRRRMRKRSWELARHSVCTLCGRAVVADRVTRRFCSTACRVAAMRARRAALADAIVEARR